MKKETPRKKYLKIRLFGAVYLPGTISIISYFHPSYAVICSSRDRVNA